MLPLGHLGIGSKIASPWSKTLPRWALLLGTVLPDALDKSFYYLTGAILSTRALGHTGVLLLSVAITARLRHSKILKALALGIATHALLDNLADIYFNSLAGDVANPAQYSAWIALLWPFYKSQFAAPPFTTLAGHVQLSMNPFSLGLEIIGAAILLWDYRQNRRAKRIND